MKKLSLDEDSWADIELLVELFKPIVNLLCLVDSDLPTMGKVHSAPDYDVQFCRKNSHVAFCKDF